MRFGAVLRACRIQAGLSQEALAAKLYISQSDVSKIETNQKEPTISIVQAWIRCTQSTEFAVPYLFGLDVG